MTNQTIPPCPVCGTVPIHINDHEAYYYAKCQCEYPKHVTKTPVDCWPQICWIKLGKYVAEALDIHTIAQLNARLAPDPRVAVLAPIQALLDEWPKYRDSVLGRKDDPPCSVCGGELDTGWECNACGHDMQMEVCPDIKLWGQITRLIAAQRGEGV